MIICVAGKNNIAVDVLEYLRRNYPDAMLCVVCNSDDTGKNSFQKSLRWYANRFEIKEYLLDDVYAIKDLLFLSMEFDRLVNPELFCDARLYNIHFSYLPAYKGMYTSAIPILLGERETGVTFHKIDSGVDTGDIIAQESFVIGNITCRELYLKYIKYGTDLVIKNLDDVIKGNEKSFQQPSLGSTYYSRKYIDYQDLKVDLKQTAQNIDQQIRAFNFREYQLAAVYNRRILSTCITNIKSIGKPGEIIIKNNSSMMISTMDYNIILNFDKFEELLNACESGDILKVKEICIEKGHINSKNAMGWSPLMVATYHNQIEIVSFLICIGADIWDVNNNGTNMLMYAKEAYKRFGDNRLYRLYKKLGLQEEREDYFGNNLYHYLSEEDIGLQELIVG